MLLFSHSHESAVLREFKAIWSGAFPWLPSATLKTELVPEGQAVDCLEFLAMFWNNSNRPLPSSKNPHFQNEARCTTFLVKMSFICMRMKNDFHIKGWAPALVLKQRPGGTQKWPIIVSASLGLQGPCGFPGPSEFAAFHELSLAQGILLPPHFAVSFGLYPCGFPAYRSWSPFNPPGSLFRRSLV